MEKFKEDLKDFVDELKIYIENPLCTFFLGFIVGALFQYFGL